MKKGLALIVVIGVLGVLAVLAAAFVAMAQLERRASEQRVNAARAYLLARSGIEDALARLDLGQDPVYGGEDWDRSGTLNGFENDAEVHQRGVLNIDDCPLRHALRPSFFARSDSDLGADGRPAPRRTMVDGRDRGYSGMLSGESTYALKVSSGQGFYVNGGDPAFPATEGYNAVLRRMLGTLAEAIDRDVQADGTLASDDGKPVDEKDGWRLIDARPSRGWTDWDQVRKLALGDSQEKLEVLKPYLTLNAWVDRKVIAPNATEAMVDRGYRSWGEIKLDRAETRPDSRAPDFERINGRIVGRAPVDLAWARKRRPALIALFGGLRGLYLEEEMTSSPMIIRPVAASTYQGVNAATMPADLVGTLREARLSLTWSSSDDCHRVAEQLLASGSSLETWQAWNVFCDGLGLADEDPDYPWPYSMDMYESLRILILGQAKRDLLKANFNPNSDLNKFSPNPSMWKSVDKSDLLATSTEFGLLPALGSKEIACAGRVLGQRDGTLALQTLKALVDGPSVFRVTTQREFVCENLGDPAVAGDEETPRLPGNAHFVSLNVGHSKTWGHVQPELGGRGVALQTYPEPVVGGAGGLSIRPADWDGNVQLATVETRADEMYMAQAAPQDMKMLARYTTGFDLDAADGEARNIPDVRQVTYGGPDAPPAVSAFPLPRLPDPADPSELAFSVLHARRPNTLHPDGCYSERERAPQYLDRGNANGLHGVLSSWVKPNHISHALSSYGSHARGHPMVKWTNFITPGTTEKDPDQFFCLCQVPKIPGMWYGNTGGFYGHVEIGHALEDTDMEFAAKTADVIPHRWSLVTMSWDFRAARGNEACQVIQNDGRPVSNRGINNSYKLYQANNNGNAADITADDVFGPHRIDLGCGRPLDEPVEVPQALAGGADATFDEFAIWDFGGAGPEGSPPASAETLDSPQVLAFNRFREGRYYRESDYAGLLASAGENAAAEYFSPPIRLDPLARIRGLAWTQVVPRGLRAPLPPGGEAGIDGDPGPDAAVSFELADIPGTDYARDARGYPIDQRFTDDAFSPVGRAVDRPFRLHAVFQPNLANAENTPILDPLTLDDVTVLYEPAGGPRVISWSQGEE